MSAKKKKLKTGNITLQNFSTRAHYYILLLILFLMPFYRQAIPPLIILLIIFWFLQGNLKENFYRPFKNRFTLLLLLFYFLHIVGLLYSTNQPAGRFDLEVKLSLLLFPFLMGGIVASCQKEQVNHFLWCFVISNIISSLICFIAVIPKIPSEYYLYSEFTVFLHPSYGAMYVLFSISILVNFLMNGKIPEWKNVLSSQKMKWLMVGMILFLCGIVFLYSSRAGLLSGLAIILVSLFVFFYKIKLNLFVKITAITLSLFVLLFLVNQNRRFVLLTQFFQTNTSSQHTLNENVSVRYQVVLETLNLIKENFWKGVGTGDVKDVLMNRYHQAGIISAEVQNMNVHNQFLETTLGLGIVGGVLLLSLTLLPFILGIKHRNLLLVFFSIIIIVNFMFESMLNTQNGVVFFSLFYSLLMTSEDN
ncbi:MAG: hypothetical protein A3H98_07240 [Bacteroidetes bacterium RIFCSPLOWO2_02_FULL_36_8]|nr:MAG: hypothetical protein A3H98_07240 [Bacteroidetes bacterium RIFCSPLOWO2_02_FULL_36_8]OFY70884.1 MAG: hypothetical protein A3G23_12245 [Bacteroidetes bacterium RIFCSPLOWO2_12_FULL_37_12]